VGERGRIYSAKEQGGDIRKQERKLSLYRGLFYTVRVTTNGGLLKGKGSVERKNGKRRKGGAFFFLAGRGGTMKWRMLDSTLSQRKGMTLAG